VAVKITIESGATLGIAQSDQTVQEMRQLADLLANTVGHFRS
jgi:hypothetical protein